jgi:DNA-binding transcriptional LysR family regulator
MELHQLRYLRAVVRTGSVTTAAAGEFVSQPSVSKQLRLLERELGVPLFHRVGRRVIATEAGMALADCADRVFDDLNATVSGVSGPESVSGGTLRMCATETIANNLLPPALAKLRARYPRCHVRVEMLGTEDAIAQVLANEVDLAIVAIPVADSRLEVRPLLEEDVLLAVPLDHPWSKRAFVTMHEVLGEPDLLLSMPGHGLRALVDEASQKLGLQRTPGLELRSQAALLAMVSEGGGIAFAPRMTVAGRTDIAALQLLPNLSRQVGWTRRRGRHLPSIGAELLSLLSKAS